MRALGANETCCFHVAANPRRFYGSRGNLGDSRLFYPSGGYKPMVWLTILMIRTNAAPGFLCRLELSCLRGGHRTS